MVLITAIHDFISLVPLDSGIIFRAVEGNRGLEMAGAKLGNI